MKLTHIILIIGTAILAGVAYFAFGGSNKFASFREAAEKPEKTFQVAGNLDKSGEIIYTPEVDANSFTFHLTDRKGQSCKVVLNKAKPYDFERADEIVVTGTMKDSVFYANDILLKCPSKYNDAKTVEVK